MGLTLREAVGADAGLLYQWRLRDEQDASWWHGEPVTWKAHYEWFLPRLHSQLVQLYVAEVDGKPVGQARVDSNGELSFSVHPDHRGRGYATELIREVVRLTKQPRLKASVDGLNVQSIRALTDAGFTKHDDVVFLRWP